METPFLLMILVFSTLYVVSELKDKFKNKQDMNLETIINDIDIVIDAILNEDYKDAVNMLKDIQEDLKIIEELNK